MKKQILSAILILAIVIGFGSCKKEVEVNSPYHIGQYLNGGIVAYIDATGQHGLITDTIDAYGHCNWSVDGDIVVNTNTMYNSGASNTLNIIHRESIEMGYAAYWATCNYYTSNYSDWFLPSKDELNFIYKNNSKFLCLKNKSNNNYWTSSNDSTRINVWVQNFTNGKQLIVNQLDSASVMKVRKF